MSVAPFAARRWPARAGMAAAAAGACVAVGGCSAATPLDPPATLQTTVVSTSAASPPQTSAPEQSAAALAAPVVPATPTAPAARNPFLPLDAPRAPLAPAGVLAGVLARGSTGDGVRAVQQSLVGHSWALAVDGVYGSRTERAVTDFQRRHGLLADGLVGPRTWQALQRPPQR